MGDDVPGSGEETLFTFDLDEERLAEFRDYVKRRDANLLAMLQQEILRKSSILGDPEERFRPNPIIMDQNPEMKNLLQTVTPVLTNGVMQVVLLGTVKIRKSNPLCVKEKFFEILLYLDSEQKAKEAKTKEAEKEKKSKPSTSKEIRACFGPAKDCANCKSKGAELMQFPPNDEDDVLQPGAKEIHSFKRCSACHVVAYCSEDCQREHWINNHQKMCRILSNKKKLGRSKHTKENCFSCSGKEPSDWFNLMNLKREQPNICPVEQCQTYLVGEYWAFFGYHKESACKCTKGERTNYETDVSAYPMQCPFAMGEMTGEYYGWIDKKLALLNFYLKGIIHLYPEETEQLAVFNIQFLILSMRATYWYLATGEKRSNVTEVLFSTYVTLKHNKKDSVFLRVENMFKRKMRTKNVWWETFLFHMADFYKRLGWTKYLSFNVLDLDQKKRKEFEGLESIHSHAISCLNDPIQLPHETTLPDQAKLTTNLLFLLPSGTKCSCCERDLGGLSATWMLQNKIYRPLWVPDTPENPDELPNPVKAIGEWMLVREQGMPVIFEYPSVSEQNNSDHEFTLVSCARNTNCLVTVANMQLDKVESWARLSINWLFKSQRCHGCLKFCYESHRCSSCRSVRYCSKECLSQDWKGHEGSCKNLALEPTEAISTRKLEGNPRSAFFAKCIHYLMTSDPYFEHFAAKWKQEGLQVDDLIVQPVKKEKDKSMKDAPGSVKHKKKKKVKEENTNPSKKAPIQNHTYEKTPADAGIEMKKKSDNSSKPSNGGNTGSSETMGNKERNENLGDQCKICDKKIVPSKKKHSNDAVRESEKSLPAEKHEKEAHLGETPDEKDNRDQCHENKEAHVKTEVEIFHDKGNGVEGNTDAVYIKARSGNTDMNMAALLKTDDISKEVGKMEEMLVRNGFDMDNVKITTMKVIQGRGQSKEDCLEQVKQAITGQAPCKACACEKEDAHKAETVEPTKELTKYAMPEKTKEELQKEGEVYSKKLDQFRKGLEKKHFEIRHIKTHTWMNGRICKVEDISKQKSRYDPRLICTIKGNEQNGQQYSLKPSTMVDCYVDVEDLDIYTCQSGVMYKKQLETNLCETMVLNFLARAMLWIEDQGYNKLHQQARLSNLKKILSEDVDNAAAALAKTRIKCMDFPEEGDMAEIDPISATLAAVRPGCINDGIVDFTRFGEVMCGCHELGDQLRNRFREFLISGMCPFCQIYYIERQHSEGEKGNVFLGETFVKLSRPTPTAFYGDKSRLCISLGFKEDDFYFFCSLVDQCFKQNSPKPSLATKLLLGFVKARFEKEKKKSVQKGQFDACLEMMKEANLVKQVGNSILHLSSFKRASD